MDDCFKPINQLFIFMINRHTAKVWVILFILSWLHFAYAQAPSFNYPTGNKNYTVGSPISQVAPITEGGAVPPATYGTVTTFAGNGIAGTADGVGTAASLSGPVGIAIDASNNLYVTDYIIVGIPCINDMIRKITSGGSVTTLAGNANQGSANGQGSAASFYTPNGTAVDPAGNVYVADAANNVIRKITPSGLVSTFAGNGVSGLTDGAANKASFSAPTGIAIDAAGNFYVADYGNDLIRKITPGGVVSTLAGGGPGFSTNGSGANASFKNPEGVTVDAAGNIYVADSGNNLIRKITPAGDVTTYAGTGAQGSANGALTSATFFRPTGVAADKAGDIFVTDASNNLVREITVKGQVITFAGSGAVGKNNGNGTSASFQDPEGLAVDGNGDLYVGDKGNNLVRKIIATGYTISPGLPAGLNFDVTSGIITGTPKTASPTTIYTITGYNAFGSSTAQVTITVTGSNGIPPVSAPAISYQTPQVYKVNLTISNLPPKNTGGAVPTQLYGYAGIYAGNGIPGSSNNTVPTNATFTTPYGVAMDSDGNLYVADGGNNLIRMINKNGIVTTLAGSGAAGASDGPGTSATFNQPTGVAVDASKNVFVADFKNNIIREVTPSGQVSTFATGFNNPYGLAIDGVGNIYVADMGNNQIKKITTGGIVSVFAGSGSIGSSDGVGTAASFSIPQGIAIDEAGYLYVADSGDNLIRKITPGGLVTTLAGSGNAGYSDGMGAAASFKSPVGITVDAIGNVYVGEAGNDVIRKITPGGLVTTLSGLAGSPGRGNGQGTAARFSDPQGITIDPYGNLYVADVVNNIIREVSTNGYTISSALPAGLSFDGTTGIISGTPTAASPATNYTITAYNTGGSNTTIVNITVLNPVIIIVNPPNISYVTPQNYVVNTPILTLGPANTGGAVPQSIYGQVNAFAGSGSSGASNGAGTAASFSALHGVATDLVGNVYICDNNLIRKITPSGVVSTMAGSSTAGSADGQGAAASFNQPGALTVDADGNVYVADTKNDVIRKVTQAGAVTTIAGTKGATGLVNGAETAALFNSPSGITIDPNGDLYVADAGNNVIRKITSAGVVSTIATGINNPGSMTADQSGNVYVLDGNSEVKKITPAGAVSTLAAGFNNPLGISADVAGNVYVTDAGSNTIKKISPGGQVSTFAGSGSAGAVNGNFSTASFNRPYGIASDIFGNIYVADFNNRLVRQIVTTGYTIDKALPPGLTFDGKTGFITGTPTTTWPTTIYTVVAYNTGGSSTATISITVSTSSVPIVPKPDISYTPADPVYLVRSPITPLSPVNSGGILPTGTYGLTTTFAGTGSPGVANGQGTSASFDEPFGVAVDTKGNIYIADHLNNLVRKITPDGVVTTLAGSGSIGKQDGTGTAASFNNPTGIAVDVAGNIYVADVSNNLVRKITPSGVVTTLAGTGGNGSVNGPGSQATFSNPSGIAVDGAGNVYIADLSNNLVRKITPGGVVSTLAGSGYSGDDDGTGTAATFNEPNGLAVDPQGNVYVSDLGDNTIRKITPAGVVTTIAGSGKVGKTDGQGTAASFNQPFGIAIDENGNLYIADTGNEEIREISSSGLVSTVAGNGTRGSNNDVGSLTTFYQPTGVISDGAGDIYIADEFNHLIRKVVTIGDYTIDKTLPAGLTFDRNTGIISGTPTVVTPSTVYTVTAYNQGGSSSFPITITINPAPLTPQVITFNPIATKTYGDPDFDLAATSTNTTIPITYTSSNTGAATIVDGQIHITGAGTTTITANQAGDNTSYLAADPVTEVVTVNPAPLTITADDKTRPYGIENPPLTVTITGFVYKDTKAQLTNQPSVSTTATPNSPVGTYPITASGNVSPNYTVTYIDGTLTITPVPSMISVPNTFTPNGDGINDVWNIGSLNDFPECTVAVYSRYGSLVYHSRGYTAPWDGTSNGSKLPAGVYYFIIDPHSGLKQVTGYVTLLR